MPAPDPDAPLTLLGGRSPADFLRHYWQRSPLLVQAAIPGFVNPLEPDDLAGLACDPDASSRLILGDMEQQQWEVEYGPFEPERFNTLPPRAWTLLVSDVERFWPESETFLRQFDFVPRWRRDDLMISYAVPGGSVGPHVDRYDVFLFQAAGHRRWQIQDPPGPMDCHDDLPLAILRDFEPSATWTLAPGDLLYLPPGVPHHGVALDDDCMTWSIGFRTPALLDLLTGFLEERANVVGDEARYTDAGRPATGWACELPTFDHERLRDALRILLTSDDHEMNHFLGRFLTRPTGSSDWLPESTQAPAAAAWRLHPGIRRAWLREAPGTSLYMAGNRYPANRLSPEQLERLCQEPVLRPRDWTSVFPAIQELIHDGWEEGWLTPDDEEMGE